MSKGKRKRLWEMLVALAQSGFQVRLSYQFSKLEWIDRYVVTLHRGGRRWVGQRGQDEFQGSGVYDAVTEAWEALNRARGTLP